MARSFVLAYLFVWLLPSFVCAKVNEVLNNPNILMIVSDEEGAIPHGWKKDLEPWYEANLPGREMLKKNGVVFNNHYVSATACVPSRGVLYTGQFTELTQTNGFAKPWNDPSMKWLHEYQVPTIGNWLIQGGFSPNKVAYFGKWHLSDAELRDARGNLIQTLTPKFKPIPENIAYYRGENVLAPFGFPNGWIGPEPHGAALENSAEYRDPMYLDEMKAFLAKQAELKKQGNKEPFAAFFNPVNPHDIVLIWAIWLAGKLKIDPNSPIPPICPETDYLDLSKEAPVHACYESKYKEMYCWPWAMKKFYDGDKNHCLIRQFYYQLIKKSDETIHELLQELIRLDLYKDTLIVFTSDHGDLVARRGGQQQKWHSLHQEVVKVPLVFSHPLLTPSSVNQFTSHIDIVPTLLKFAGVDEEATRPLLAENFSKVAPLPGQDLSELVIGEQAEDFSRVIYSRTEDDISRGTNKYAATWYNLLPAWLLRFVPFGSFKPIEGSRFVESIRLFDTGLNGVKNEWSFMHYWDPDGKTPEEYRLYKLNVDGFEVKDFSHLYREKVEDFKQKMSYWREYYQVP